LVCVLVAWWSGRGVCGCGDAGGGFVDDGLAVGAGSDEGLNRQVVDGPWRAAAGVDENDGVVAEERVGSASLRWWLMWQAS
jgi:hypothetical protein